MSEENKNTLQTTFSSIPETVISIIKDPAGFFRSMPKTGGFVDPLIFVAVMSTVGALVQALLAVVGMGVAVSVVMAFAGIIFVPILAAIFSFVGALIAFIIWRLMGSTESYETAYRSCAYVGAIYPFYMLINAVPYIGAIAGAVWMAFLFITISVEVHRVKKETAMIVFGILFALMAIMSISSRMASRRVAKSVEDFQLKHEAMMEDMEDMTPEEAGKAMGQFLKGMSQAAQEMEAQEQAAQAQE